MLRTSRRMLAVAAVLLAISACGALPAPDEAFSVNGVGESRAQLDAVLSDLAEAGDVTLDNGEAGDEIVRTIMRQLIRVEAFSQFADDRGLTITDADRQRVIDLAQGDTVFLGYTDLLQRIIIELNVIEIVLDRLPAPDRSDLATAYENDPVSTGMLCLSHILVESRSDADKVLARLADGADFATVAREDSIEPAAATSGGALPGADGEECQPLTALQQGYDADFVRGAVRGKAGVPFGPVQTQFGWHVILNRPLADVEASLARVASVSPGSIAFEGFLATSDVRVASRYGRWQPGLSIIA